LAIAQYVLDRIGEAEISDFLFQEFLEPPNKKMAGVLKSKAVRKDSVVSDSFGDSFINEFENEAEDMSLNFEDIKSALKTESKIDRIEAFMNSDDVQVEMNKNIRHFLNKSDNLEIFTSLVSRPHEVESRVWWKPIKRIPMKDRRIFEDYREYNLVKHNNYYLYDYNKLHKMDYTNKNPELKNVYRSFNALSIFLTGSNLEIILDSFKDAHSRILLTLRDALEPKNNASLEHLCLFLRTLIVERAPETMDILLEYKYPILMIPLLDSQPI